MKNVALVAIVAAMLVACGAKVETRVSSTPTEQPQRQPARGEPTDQVADFDNMVIYAIVVNPNPNAGPGKSYMYWVRDNSDRGWMFFTDKKYNIGDRLAIVLAAPTTSTVAPSIDTTDPYTIR